VEGAFQGVIDLCLQKNPARRFQNVAELAAALLPFASSRARLHAQRAASILGTRDAHESSAMASPVPLLRAESAAELLPSELFPSELLPAEACAPELSPSELSLPEPAPRALSSSATRIRSPERAPGHRPGIGLPGTMALGASLVLLLAAGLRGVHTRSGVGVHAEPIALAAGAEAPLRVEPKQDAVATDSAPEPGASRTVLIESQPSGAVVKIQGQPIGVTPLSTLLPPGTVRLALEKAGYLEAQTVVELEPGGRGSKPLHTRVVLEEAPPKPAPALDLHRGHELGAPPGARSARARPEPHRPRLRLVQD
jgi:serine/threonine-protein kinase